MKITVILLLFVYLAYLKSASKNTSINNGELAGVRLMGEISYMVLLFTQQNLSTKLIFN